MGLWLVHGHGNGSWDHRGHAGHDPASGTCRLDLDREPSPCVQADGIWSVARHQAWLEDDDVRVVYDPSSGPTFDNPARDITDRPCVPVTVGTGGGNGHHFTVRPGGETVPIDWGDKPPYRVLPMSELHTVEPNGMTVASTFSGAGGSCLGYRYAGFRVAWANEFVEAAQDCYRANFPDSILDTRDIRTVEPGDVLDQLGMRPGELDLLDGSPPCQSFSTAGKRQRGWGQVAAHGDGSVQRSDDLFHEYVRLLTGIRPRAFVAENVSGLVKGVAKGQFKEILAGLRGAGYRVAAAVVDAQWCGVPQQRQRVIFQGIRDDLGADPVFPAPLPYRYTVREALHDLTPGLVQQIVGNDAFEPVFGTPDVPHPTITAVLALAKTNGEILVEGANGFNGHAPRPDDLPAATVQAGRTLRVEHAATGGRPTANLDAREADPHEPAPTVMAQHRGWSDIALDGHVRRRLTIAELRRICSFPDDFVLTGSYAEQWARLGNSVPPLMMHRVASAVRDLLLSLDA